MALHPVTGKITGILKQQGCWFETFEHEPVKTSEEAARTRPGYTHHQGAKAMIVRAKKSSSEREFLMLVYPADLKFSNRKVKEICTAKDLRFASVDEVSQLTGGVKPGAVPPFGTLFGMRVIADARLFDNEKIVFNAGDRSFSVAMKSVDYRSIVKPRIADITA